MKYGLPGNKEQLVKIIMTKSQRMKSLQDGCGKGERDTLSFLLISWAIITWWF
jgi:hypothetical protein